MGTIKEEKERKKGFGAFQSRESILIFLYNVLFVLQKGMLFILSVLFIGFVLVTQAEFQTKLRQGDIQFGDMMTAPQNLAIGNTVLSLTPAPLILTLFFVLLLWGMKKSKSEIKIALTMGIFVPYLLLSVFFSGMIRETWVWNYGHTLYVLFLVIVVVQLLTLFYEKYIMSLIKFAMGEHGRVYSCDLQQLTNHREAIFEVAEPWKEFILDEGNATLECQPGFYSGKMNATYLKNDTVVWRQQRRVRNSFLRFNMQPDVWLLTKEGMQQVCNEGNQLNKKVTFLGGDTIFVEETNLPWREKIRQLFHVNPENKKEGS